MGYKCIKRISYYKHIRKWATLVALWISCCCVHDNFKITSFLQKRIFLSEKKSYHVLKFLDQHMALERSKTFLVVLCKISHKFSWLMFCKDHILHYNTKWLFLSMLSKLVWATHTWVFALKIISNKCLLCRQVVFKPFVLQQYFLSFYFHQESRFVNLKNRCSWLA